MTQPSLYDEQARATLQQPVIVRVTTISADGYPHTTPVWFILDGDDLLIFGNRDTRKAKNIRTNPKGCLSIGGDPVGVPTYLIEGDFTIEDDPDHIWTAKITRHYEPADKAEEWLASWQELDFVVLRLKPRRIIKV
jgi:PPOX class probable F420-dependent enzyme